MTNGPGGQGHAPDPQPNSETTTGETPAQKTDSDPSLTPATESTAIIEPYKASEEPVIALRRDRTKHSFRKRSLGIISGLIVFFTVATLGTALIATAYFPDGSTTLTTLASDIAKTAIPTLIALLGTAAAWAFKDSEKD